MLRDVTRVFMPDRVPYDPPITTPGGLWGLPGITKPFPKRH